jgi:hypothetical protein
MRRATRSTSSGAGDPAHCEWMTRCCFRLAGVATGARRHCSYPCNPRARRFCEALPLFARNSSARGTRRTVGRRPTQQRAGAPSGAPGLLLFQEAGVSACALGRRPTQQRAAGRTGAPRQLLCREAGVLPCAPPRRLYEGGRVVNGRSRCLVRARGWVGGERRSCLYRPVGSRGLGVIGVLVWRCMSIVSRQAARRKGAPVGAKGWLRVSMCQIDSVSLRARSIWATLGPRWRPRRRLVCW